MEGKVFGIPLILILLVGFTAALVDIPMYGMYRAQQDSNAKMELMMQVINVRTRVVPTITPTVSPVPTIVKFKAVVPSTQSGKVK